MMLLMQTAPIGSSSSSSSSGNGSGNGNGSVPVGSGRVTAPAGQGNSGGTRWNGSPCCRKGCVVLRVTLAVWYNGHMTRPRWADIVKGRQDMASKTDKKVTPVTVYVERVKVARDEYAKRAESAAATLDKTLRDVAADMSADGYTDVQIAAVVGKSKQQVGRMVAAARAAKVGADPSKVEAALAAGKVTLTAVRKAAEQKGQKGRDAIATLGLQKASAEGQRKGAQKHRSADDIIAADLDAIVDKVKRGKADAAATLSNLRHAATKVERYLAGQAKRDAEADMA
jgi:hypothetical protein